MAVSSEQLAINKPDPWQDLRGKIVMVTGASSGIGWEFCIALAKSGCRIIATARRMNRLKSLCDEINNLDRQENEGEARNPRVLAVAVELDVNADGSTIKASVRKAWEAFGHIDVLINNAGIRGPVQNSLDWSEEDWDEAFRTNVKGSWLVSKYVCLQMHTSNQAGSIINISSTAALHRSTYSPGCLAYASSKSALDTMTKVMAMELGKYNIRVNSICPGLFKSEITSELMQKKWLKNVASKVVPLRDFGTIDPALTSLIRYLIHNSSDYVTGNIFIVDSGYTSSGIPLYSSL
ncbi:putative 3-oxoacyl-[acyl-carrier-protein] reductase [Helianthus annuus]|nr:putative 3-oxoacyl-[acyl-carrier-protein] reductase [Helianthus annuus]